MAGVRAIETACGAIVRPSDKAFDRARFDTGGFDFVTNGSISPTLAERGRRVRPGSR
jgi:hypothetical protein